MNLLAIFDGLLSGRVPASFERICQPSQSGSLCGLTFPDNQTSPSQFFERGYIFAVPCCIAFQLVLPEPDVALWLCRLWAAGVSMPEAAVNKNDGPIFAENKVGGTGKSLYMQTVPEAAGMQKSANQHLGNSIFSPNPRHHPAARCRINDVNHQASSWLPNALIKTG
jgi:hypothetical protein